jgi:myo-inositol 2-dehydrogenase / D-chiro-inositol 1-dehydrogenase
MRIAVLGTGRMGASRAELLAGRPDVEEVVLAGRDRARAETVAGACGARGATVQEALDARPDGVVVASATADHAAQLEACAALGAPVLCEKPIALTTADTSRAIERLRDAGVVAQIGFQRRFDPAFAAVRERAAAGGLGTLYSVRISVHDADPPPEHYVPHSGGIFRDMHVHDFDLARWITGREVATAYATGAVRRHDYLARHGDVDVSAVVLTMDDGLPVLIDGSRHDPRGYHVGLQVLGSEDSAGVEPVAGLSSFAERFAAAFAAETDAFIALVRDGGDSPCPPETALEALRVAIACDRSRAEGRPVAVEEIPGR